MTANSRVLVVLTYGFSVRYVLSTGVLAALSTVCRPVVALGWDDPELETMLAECGGEVVRLPEARLDHDYRMFRRRMATIHQIRLSSRSSLIERRHRLSTMDRKARALSELRRRRDRIALALPGAVARTESEEADRLRRGTNVAAFSALLDENAIDAVVSVTPYHDQDALLLFAARETGVPSLTSVISFDNPTTRDRMVVRSDRVLVWNRFNRDELLRAYPDLTEDRIGVVGAPQFDLHHRSELVRDEGTWRRDLGLPQDRPVILYGGGPASLVPHETRLVELLDDAIDRGDIVGKPFLLVRRHPAEAPAPWRELGERLRNGRVVEPWAAGSDPHRGWPTTEDLVVLMSSLAHSKVHVNICSSMTLDGAMFDRPQIGPTFVPGLNRREQRQLRDLYEREHWKPITRSRGLRTAGDPAQLIAAVVESLHNPQGRSTERRRMVRDLLTFTDGASSTRLVDEVAALVSLAADG